ncbi:MAG: DUF6491 family protein [Rhodanobacteraceae bacterium]
MKTWIVLLLGGLVATTGSANADTRATQQRNLDKYTPYLETPVDSFQFWSLYKWQLAGPDKVVVWPTIKKAYLLTVEQPCPRLEWTSSIGITSVQLHQVSKRFDYVALRGDRCRITKIQPIDVGRMDKQRDAAGK